MFCSIVANCTKQVAVTSAHFPTHLKKCEPLDGNGGQLEGIMDLTFRLMGDTLYLED